MEIDTERVDAAVLALLLLGLHEGCRVWKGFDWDAMERLHEKGFISDPVGKAKSVILTEEQREAERLFAEIDAANRKSASPKVRERLQPAACQPTIIRAPAKYQQEP